MIPHDDQPEYVSRCSGEVGYEILNADRKIVAWVIGEELTTTIVRALNEAADGS